MSRFFLILIFLCEVTSWSQQSNSLIVDGIRVDESFQVSTVNLSVSLRKGNKVIVPKDRFVADEFVVRNSRGERIPVDDVMLGEMSNDILLLIDTSGSISHRLPEVQSAIKEFLRSFKLNFLNKSNESLLGFDRVALMTFNKKVKMLTPGFTSNYEVLERNIDDLITEGETDLEISLSKAISYFENSPGAKHIIIFTDAEDDRHLVKDVYAAHFSKSPEEKHIDQRTREKWGQRLFQLISNPTRWDLAQKWFAKSKQENVFVPTLSVEQVCSKLPWEQAQVAFSHLLNRIELTDQRDLQFTELEPYILKALSAIEVSQLIEKDTSLNQIQRLVLKVKAELFASTLSYIFEKPNISQQDWEYIQSNASEYLKNFRPPTNIKNETHLALQAIIERSPSYQEANAFFSTEPASSTYLKAWNQIKYETFQKFLKAIGESTWEVVSGESIRILTAKELSMVSLSSTSSEIFKEYKKQQKNFSTLQKRVQELKKYIKDANDWNQMEDFIRSEPLQLQAQKKGVSIHSVVYGGYRHTGALDRLVFQTGGIAVPADEKRGIVLGSNLNIFSGLNLVTSVLQQQMILRIQPEELEPGWNQVEIKFVGRKRGVEVFHRKEIFVH